ncbi:ZIP family metal transporter [Alkalimonas collagenimarina]|uniref:ZIP family metal transporter n=1 Tax=Alkalimonas collagenimarina TaxID=400390 RepID=A0ABT9GZL8_9GAMM|nr:ZIP family metal transporter [Alkalimonas collagenimarina]MDP4536511.1 ZIP family metal transporter [Alkalimonas collagenimarina]
MLIQLLLASSTVLLVALLGGFLLMLARPWLSWMVPVLIGLAIGVLLGSAWLHLIPEALESASSSVFIMLMVLLGFLLFHLLEQGLHWHHHHVPDGDARLAQYAKMNLVGDGLHNAVDGVLIAASFMVDPALGWATTLAVVWHELPKEISDVAVLMHGGASLKRAIVLNTLCSLPVFAGALLLYALGQWLVLPLSALLAITAGGFSYIALIDLYPLLKSDVKRTSWLQQAALFCGLGLMLSFLLLEGH